MANNINCTCGHSWSKASSSKKDMYVCHICGKDNTMKDGGWLDNYGKKPNPNDVQVSTGPGYVGLGYDVQGRDYSPAWGGQFAMGGSLPGAVGFTYARVAGSAPSNGKYAKKTKASAQNGKEMKFYQEGLDFKPNSIAQDGAIVDPMGQWAHPGEVTIIPSTDITMEGVDYPVLGISDTGDQQMMYPGEDYQFDGDYVTEYPMMKQGGWLSKYQDGGGGLSRSNLEMMSTLTKDIKNQKARNAQETVSQYTPKPGDQQRMNAAKSAYRAEEAKPLNRAASSRVAAKTMENIVEPMLAIETGMGASKLVKPALETAGKYLTEKIASKRFSKFSGVDDLGMFTQKGSNKYYQLGEPKNLETNNVKINNKLKDWIEENVEEFTIKPEPKPDFGSMTIDKAESENYLKNYQKNLQSNYNRYLKDRKEAIEFWNEEVNILGKDPKDMPPMLRDLINDPNYKNFYLDLEPDTKHIAQGLVSDYSGTDINANLVDKDYLPKGGRALVTKDSGEGLFKKSADNFGDYKQVKPWEVFNKNFFIRKNKNGGWLSKFDTAQPGGTFMSNLMANEDPTLNKNTGDMRSYFPEIKRMQEKPKNDKAIAQNEQKIKKQILADAVANAKGKQATVKQDNRTSREKEIAQKQLLDLKMDEARSTSPFTQTLSSFTPTGSNEAAGQIFAEGVGQMTPMIGATRLFNTVRDPENNPYGIGQGNGFLANTLGTLGLLGDVFDVGAVTAPGVRAAGKYLTEQTPLKNAYKINPFAFEPTEGMMYRGLGVEGMEDALQSGVFRAKQDVEPSMVGNFDMSKRFNKAYFSPRFDVADQYGQGYIAEVPRTASDWGKRYGKKEWSQIAQRDIPITEGKILQKDWLRGYKEVPQPGGVATPNLGSAIEQSNPLKNISETEATSSNVKSPWKPQELPGLHLSSTMEGGPISKIVEPKTGLVNVEQALGIIAKESGGASKASLIRKALGKDIPKKMDYNDFRKTVQDQLIPLDKQFVTHASNYGIGRIGYPAPKRSSFEMAIENNKKAIADLEQQIALKKSLNSQDNAVLNDIKRLEDELAESNNQINISLNELDRLPIENKTLVLSNADKFGRGSSAHDNPMETLGHIHFMRDAESPDVLTVTQMQSDAFQGTHRSMPKSLEEAEFSLQSLENIVSQRNNVLESLKRERELLTDVESINRIDKQIDDFTRLIKDQTAFNKFNKAEVENFAQKSLLDKNHQERYLQELVDYAGKRGDINKVRVPTKETAAKVQNYQSVESEEVIKEFKKLQEDPAELAKRMANMTESEKKFLQSVIDGKITGKVYDPNAATILKKYSEQPKLIKKLFGVEPKIVTDGKGNTWYEFDIPNKFKGGAGEIKAFKDGGWLNKYK